MDESPDQRPDWANLKVLHRNTLPPRSDFYLYDTEKDALSRDRSKARCQCLSGKWKFNLTNSPLESPVGFEAESFDSSQWSEITVPGMWQLQGFGRGPHYTNVQFPFFVDPPNPPFTDNECGSYITRFTIPKHLQDDQLRLRFEGVDSAFHVWLNGREVGYSQGARNPSEFEVTEFVKKNEENVLAVRVYQFCDGSYIEDQDQWWLSGIFRDVWFLGFPREAQFEDVSLQTILDDQYEDATLQVQVVFTNATKINLKLKDAEGVEVATAFRSGAGGGTEQVSFSVPVNKPHKWTAERPYLCDLVLSIDDSQFTAHRVGFRQVELKDGLIKVNGQRVVFKGANRHEHHPRSGRTVPLEFLKHDLLLMKNHNINAIRTCHQPSDPRLYDLADELGFWVMDEADLECHGFETIEDAALNPEQRCLPFFERQQLTRGNAAKWTSDNPDWHDAYIDRAKQVVHRDKLHPSIIIWSLGNEAFYGRNHTAMRDWIKSYDPTRLIHYEPDLNAEYADMHSQMYPSVESIISFAEDKSKPKPLVLCEYIHAMGTGPGNIKEYVDAFYKYPTLQGGWVWEWANHGLLTRNEDGEEYYGYGGDFGDVPNDANFVMDGVLNSDHTPNSGLIEYKKALEPVQLVSREENKATIINRLDFATLDHLFCTFSIVSESGGTSVTGQAPIPAGIQPGTTAELTVPMVTPDSGGESLMDFSFKLKEKTSWADAGYELAWAQVPLPRGPAILPVKKPSETSDSNITVEKVGTKLHISSAHSEWIIDCVSGKVTSWKKNGNEMISAPLEPSFYRAPTDNDIPKDGAEWKDKMLHLATLHCRSTDWHGEDGKVILNMKQKFAPPVLSWSLDLETEYTFSASGSLSVHVKGKPRGRNLPTTLPRIGFTLGLTKDFQEVNWFGRGPGESYRDMKLSQRVGWHSASSIDELWTSPEFPQECSNRTDTRWLKLSSPNDDSSLTAQFFDPSDAGNRRLFDFMACHYDVKDIDEARHPYELEKRKKDHVVLRLDAKHHGLGTGSCGPKTLEQYALKTEKIEFGLFLY